MFACQDFIAKNGYPFLDDDILKTNLKKTSYSNPLFVPEEPNGVGVIREEAAGQNKRVASAA